MAGLSRPIVVTLAALLLMLAASTVADALLGQVCVSAMIQDATSVTYYPTMCS